MITQNGLQSVGRYCVALYRTEKIILSAFVATNIYERIIDNWLEDQKIYYEEKDSIVDKINSLDTRVILVEKKELHRLRKIRNNIVHGDLNTNQQANIKNLVEFIWKVLDNVSFLKNKMDIDNIDIIQAHYWIRDFEVLNNPYSGQLPVYSDLEFKILETDFNDLHVLSEKFYMFSKFIDTRKKLKKYGLTIDNISEVNPTSAYIWLAITDGNYQGRKKISSFSVSVLATPLDIRIYIDFGGLAFEDKKNYLDFLTNLNIKDLNIKDTSNLQLFDIEWYSFITKYYNLDILNSDDKNKIIKNAKKRLEGNTEDPMTWNSLLIGYILKKEEIEFELLWDKLENIMMIYKKFSESIKKC